MKERKDVRKCWEEGLCPCCCIELHAWEGIYGPAQVVAEGVSLCGRCIECGHDEPDVLPMLLEELVKN